LKGKLSAVHETRNTASSNPGITGTLHLYRGGRGVNKSLSTYRPVQTAQLKLYTTLLS